MNSSDPVLIDRIQASDIQAYAPLVEKYYDRIYRFCAKLVSDPIDAQSITQDVFVSAYVVFIKSLVGNSWDLATYKWSDDKDRGHLRDCISHATCTLMEDGWRISAPAVDLEDVELVNTLDRIGFKLVTTYLAATITMN